MIKGKKTWQKWRMSPNVYIVWLQSWAAIYSLNTECKTKQNKKTRQNKTGLNKTLFVTYQFCGSGKSWWQLVFLTISSMRITFSSILLTLNHLRSELLEKDILNCWDYSHIWAKACYFFNSRKPLLQLPYF